jgi:hypothetical protein
MTSTSGGLAFITTAPVNFQGKLHVGNNKPQGTLGDPTHPAVILTQVWRGSTCLVTQQKACKIIAYVRGLWLVYKKLVLVKADDMHKQGCDW